MVDRHRSVRAALAFLVICAGLGTSTAAPPNDGKVTVRRGPDGAALAAYETSGRIQRLFGSAIARGPSPEASVERLLADHAHLIGAERADLRALELVPGAGSARGLMPGDNDDFRFTVHHFEQVRDGVPIFGARVIALVRNEPTYPVVLVNPDTRDLGALRVDPSDRDAGPSAAGVAAALARVRGASAFTGEPALHSSRKVIWAGERSDPLPPHLADEMIVRLDVDEWRVLADAATGEVLHLEQIVCFADLTGNTSGLATEGVAAEQCEEEVMTAVPFARVGTFATIAYTDEAGSFFLTGLPSGPLTVSAQLSGLWFDVQNFAGADEVASVVVAPPGPVKILFNANNDDELVRAQVNAYVESNRVRDFVLESSPGFPMLDEGGFVVNVNRTDGACPGNAWYTFTSGFNMNFCRGAGVFANTAFSAVVYHEYGHHLVLVGGSGQAAYGEGMSDVIALLMQDEPEIGFGFHVDDCTSGIRSAENDLRFPCHGESHFCGRLLSGCIWEVREALAVTSPDSYLDILSALTVNSILLHSGPSIGPGISIDFLALDDDNDTIFDGTPHFDEIASGFGAHGMLAPSLAPIEITFPEGRPEHLPTSGATMCVVVAPVIAEPRPGTGVLHYDDGEGVVDIPMVEVTPNVYEAAFPAAPCRARISYSFSAATTDGATVVWPDGAPALRFEAMRADGTVTILADDFETDAGWAVQNVHLDGGAWERGVPVGNGNRGDPPTDYDGSGRCWLTENAPGYSDVDGGPTILSSRRYDLSAASDPEISYARWFTNSNEDEDRLRVLVSGDNGDTWFEVEAAPNESMGWKARSFRVRDFVELSPDVRVRFTAIDDPNDSLTEAAVDALRIFEIECDAPPCTADFDVSGDVGTPDLLDLLAAWGPCPACPEDLDGSGEVGFTDLNALLFAWGPCR